MSITPLDIRKASFKKKMRGYDPDEVDSFLEMVSVEFENLTNDYEKIKFNCQQLSEQIHSYQNLEKSLQETLVMSQKASDDMKESAKDKAQQILQDAELKAGKMIHDKKEELKNITVEIKKAEKQRDEIIWSLKQFLENQMKNVGHYEDKEIPLEKKNKIFNLPDDTQEILIARGSEPDGE